MIAIILIGLSLSIDAFSLALTYGLLDITKKTILRTSLLVGTFHFIMPIFGKLVGAIIMNYLKINSKYILIIVLLIILIEMIKSTNEDNKEYNISMFYSFIFAFLVSIDSFTIGIGINYLTNNVYKACTVFSLMSFTFTYLGFTIGKYLSNSQKKYSKFIGIIFIFTLIIYFLCKG